jgi:hypothetical protein
VSSHPHASLAVPRAQAVDIPWPLMATDNYHRLTTDRNWTHEQFREWLAATIMSQLFKSTQT